MRIYLYLRTFPLLGAPLNGGLNKAIHGLACGLAHAGAEVTILCEGWESGHTESEHGFDIRCFANRTKPTSFTVSPELKQFIEKDLTHGVVVLNGIFMPAVALIARMLKKKGIKYIAAPHDPYHPEIFKKRWYLKRPYWLLLERPMLRNATAVQVLDVEHRDDLRRMDVATTVIPLPNGCLPTDAPKDIAPFDPGDAKFLFLGRMDAHNKGLDLLISAFARLAKEVRARLTLQGPNTGDKEALQEQAKALKTQNQISFVNVDFTRPSTEVIAGHHVVCLPSRFEGFGMAALEAMLAGRPVLVSCVSGIALHVARSGCGVVAHSDVTSIQNGLTELLNMREEWQAMGRQGREYALEHLSWYKIGERALKEYRRVCKVDVLPYRPPLKKQNVTDPARLTDVSRFDVPARSAPVLSDPPEEAMLSDA